MAGPGGGRLWAIVATVPPAARGRPDRLGGGGGALVLASCSPSPPVPRATTPVHDDRHRGFSRPCQHQLRPASPPTASGSSSLSPTCPRWRRHSASPATSSTASKQGDQPLRQADQRCRRHQRPEDRCHHRQLRSHQRGRDAGPVQGLDRRRLPRLRRARRGRHLDRRQPTVHHPGRSHALAQPVDDGDQLDPGGLALSVVDGTRRRRHPAGHGRLGAKRRAPRDTASRSA